MRGLIALIVIVVVIGGVVFAGKSSTGTTPTTPKPTDSVQQPTPGAAPGVEVVAPVKIVLEAESPTAMEPTFTKPDGSVVEFLKKEKRTEGKLLEYLDVPDKLIEKCGLEKEKDKIAGLPGKASYEFEAPRDDTYYVFLRAKWFDNCGNSVWVRVDDSNYLNLEDENGKQSERNYSWVWHGLMLEGRPKGFKLTKGKHTLHMAVREDGPWLDQWLISSEATMPASAAPLK